MEEVKKGRPTVMTPEVIAEFCARLSDGETIRQICADDHMPVTSTIFRAIVFDKAFSEQYAIAREAQLARWEEELVEICDDGTNDWMERETEKGRVTTVLNAEHVNRSRLRVDTRKWIMEKRLPKKYGPRVQSEVSGPDGGPIKIDGAAALAAAMLGNAPAKPDPETAEPTEDS